MKTNSRKRLLVSSVAMLLVAMLALGTATYAWFTQNTTANTKNLSVKTNKSSSLEISKDTGGWGTEVDYVFANKTLLPASTVDGTKWVTAVADKETGFVSKKGGVSSVTLTEGRNETYFFKSQLNVRNAGGAPVKDVKINFTLPNSDAYKYIRVALVETTSQGKNVPAKVGATFNIYDNGSANSTLTDSRQYEAISEVTGTGDTQSVTTSKITPVAADGTGASVTVDTGSLAAVNGSTYDTRYYNLYVWFEGQDTDCYNANAGAAVEDIVFTVTGVTAD